MANGFIVHDGVKTMTENQTKDNKLINLKSLSHTSRHLISERDFDDILEACRPRNLGENLCGMPKALLSQMKIFGLLVKEADFSKTEAPRAVDIGSKNEDYESEDYKSRSSHSTVSSHFTSTYTFVMNQSSPSSSQVLSSPQRSSFQIQQSKSYEMPSYLLSEKDLRSLASNHDKNVFVTESKSS